MPGPRLSLSLPLLLLLGSLLLLGVVALGVSVGEMRIPLPTVVASVGNRLLGTDYVVGRLQDGVIWEYRMSRALFAALCGAGLAVSGAVLQALLRNPLAEPFLLGISAGASAGVVSVVLLGVGGGVLSLSGGAFLGAMLALAGVALLAAGSGGGAERIILAGVAGSQLFNALTSLIVTLAANAEQARGVMFWLLGNMSGVRWADVALLAPVVGVGCVLCLLHARRLDAFTFGTDAAAALGVSVLRTRLLLFATTAAMTAVTVSVVGSVGFVGLLVPHAARFLVGPTHGRLLPATLVIGAVFTVGADILSRTLVPNQTVPIGVVTALVGAPAFAVILFRSRRAAS